MPPMIEKGQEIFNWTVVSEVFKEGGRRYVWCICRLCAQRKRVAYDNLKSGGSRSCLACRQRANEHGMYKTPEYSAWHQMWFRCTNPKSKDYHNYGGRGINVFPLWRDFRAFYSYVGSKPGPEYSLSRIDNEGDYAPGNVEWATKETQDNNRRTTVYCEVEGKKVSLKQASRLTGLPYDKVRKNRGVL